MPPPDSRPIITLTTDFGHGSSYVAAVKGVILSMAPGVRIVDISHNVEPQNVRQGAVLLAEATGWFPEGTLHVAVIDPGVGTSRRLVYAQIGSQRYLAPDNGLLGDLARRSSPTTMIALTDPQYWRSEVSPTFHGRDILAPVAARLALGLDPQRLGPAVSDLIQLPRPEVHRVPGRLEGSIRSIDSFGNLVTDITAEMLEGAPRDERIAVRCDDHETRGIFTTYGDQPEMTLVALVGSSGSLEIAIVGDSAAAMLGVKEGQKVIVSWEV